MRNHGLPDYYENEIVNFIKQQAPQAPGNLPIPTTSPTTTPLIQIKRCFPLESPLIFEKGDPEKALQRLGPDIPELTQLVMILQNTSKYHATNITLNQLKVLFNTFNVLKGNDRFPAYDLLRAILLHPSGQVMMQPFCKDYFIQSIRDVTQPNVSKPLLLCALRMANNLFLSSFQNVLLAIMEQPGLLDEMTNTKELMENMDTAVRMGKFPGACGACCLIKLTISFS
jgi:hypothetical protein